MTSNDMKNHTTSIGYASGPGAIGINNGTYHHNGTVITGDKVGGKCYTGDKVGGKCYTGDKVTHTFNFNGSVPVIVQGNNNVNKKCGSKQTIKIQGSGSKQTINIQGNGSGVVIITDNGVTTINH